MYRKLPCVVYLLSLIIHVDETLILVHSKVFHDLFFNNLQILNTCTMQFLGFRFYYEIHTHHYN